MAFMDFLKEFGAGGFAGLSGNVGDVLSVAGAAENLRSSDSSLSPEEQKKHTEHSNNLAISSGAFGLLTNTLGLVDTFGNKEPELIRGLSDESAQKVKSASKAERGFGATEGILGLLSSGADMIGGFAGKSGNDGLQKGMGIASGAINVAGGAMGIGKAISSFKKYKEAGKTGDAWKSLIMGGLGGAGKIFSGITGAGSAANPDSKGWKKWNLAAAGLGGLIGLTDTGISIGEAASASPGAAPPQNQNQNAP